MENKQVGPGYFRMTIAASILASQAKPGQFVLVRCADSFEPLLRRPFSLHRINKNNVEILYKVVGQGTNLLAKKKKADTIDVLGPLGNGFQIPATSGERRATILVAGGIGVAPLLALAEKIADRKKINVFLGAKTKQELLCEKEFKKLGCKVRIATDDGSKGRKCLVTDLLQQKLSTSDERRATIYACGPNPMLKEAAMLGEQYGHDTFGSLEEKMACGLGACLGCAVKTTAGFKMVCKDGPVFDLREICWDE